MLFHKKKNGKDCYLIPRYVVIIMAEHNFVKMITEDGKLFCVDGTLEHALEAMLREKIEAVLVHRSYIVNMDYVVNIEEDEITFAPA